MILILPMEQVVQHFDKQEPQHDKHHAANPFAPAPDGVAGAEKVAENVAYNGGKGQLPKYAPVCDPHSRRRACVIPAAVNPDKHGKLLALQWSLYVNCQAVLAALVLALVKLDGFGAIFLGVKDALPRRLRN